MVKNISMFIATTMIVSSLQIPAFAKGNNKAYYLNEDFNDYVSTGTTLPAGWIVPGNGDVSSVGSCIGASGEQNDTGVKLYEDASRQYLAVDTDHEIPAGIAFVAEFDILCSGNEGFFISLPTNKKELLTQEMINDTFIIGMLAKRSTHSDTRSSAPRLGYAPESATNGAMTSFTANSEYCEITSGKWEHIKLLIEPKGTGNTDITLSNDGTDYIATTNFDFSKETVKSFAITTIKKSGEAPSVSLDNVEIYSDVDIPEVDKIEYTSAGKVQEEPTELTEKIKIAFTLPVSIVAGNVTLKNSKTGNNMDFELDVSDNKKEANIMLNEPFVNGEDYELMLQDISLSGFTDVKIEPYSVEISPIEESFKIEAIEYSEVGLKQEKPTQFTDKIKVFFSHPIDKNSATESICIKVGETLEKVKAVQVLFSKDFMSAEIDIAEGLVAGKEYILFLNDIKHNYFDSVKLNDSIKFVPSAFYTEVNDIKFLTRDGTAYNDLDAVPYSIEKIEISFNTPIEKRIAKENISLAKADKTVVEADIDAADNTVVIALDNTLLDERAVYNININKNLVNSKNGAGMEKDYVYTFSTVGQNVIIKSAEYIKEDFNSFISNEAGTLKPTGWYLTDPNKSEYVNSMFTVAGESGEDGDFALEFNNATGTRIMKAFDSFPERGETIYVEFDIKYSNPQGWLLYIPRRNELVYDKTIHTENGTNVFSFNLVIGMHANTVTDTAIRSAAPHIGYNFEKKGNVSLHPLDDTSVSVNDPGYYCDLSPDEWHHIKMKMEPITTETTNITVSVDGGKEFFRALRHDYITNVPGGIAILGATTDNFSVYSETQLKRPDIRQVKLFNYSGEELQADVPGSNDIKEIEITFDTEIVNEKLNENIRLMCGNEVVSCNYDINSRGNVVTLMPTAILEEDASYCIMISESIKSKYDSRMTAGKEMVRYFRTSEAENAKITEYEIKKDEDKYIFETEFVKTTNSVEKFTKILAEYKEVILNVEGKEVVFKKMTGIEATPITLLNGASNNRQEISITEDGTKIGAYLWSYPDGNSYISEIR